MLRKLPARIYYALRARTERAEGRRYRETYGAASYTKADIAAMWADPSCPVITRKRPIPGYATTED